MRLEKVAFFISQINIYIFKTDNAKIGMSVIKCEYFYTSGMIINFKPILQGILLIHIEKFKVFIVFDTVISTTKT